MPLVSDVDVNHGTKKIGVDVCYSDLTTFSKLSNLAKEFIGWAN
jgi:hypothetical protein